MAANQNASVTKEEVTKMPITATPSVECTLVFAHSMRRVHTVREESEDNWQSITVTAHGFKSTSDVIDVPSLDTNDDNSGYPGPISSQNSVDQLAEEYGEVGGSSDGEQPHQRNHEKVHQHAKKLAQGYTEMKKEYETLKAKHESLWKFAEAIENQKAALKNELELLKKCSSQSEKETRQLKEQIRHLESGIKDKDAIAEMLQYGAQGKCGVCSENCKIIDSHPYSKVVLETVLGADYLGILDLQQDQHLQPSSCKWKHLCHECDQATGGEEKRFKDCLVTVLKDPTSATSEKILMSQADLFHVYTFRALLRNVDAYHYIPGLEENQECTCSRLLHSLNEFRKRAHHLSKPLVWKGGPKDQLIDPFEAGCYFMYVVLKSRLITG